MVLFNEPKLTCWRKSKETWMDAIDVGRVSDWYRVQTRPNCTAILF